jgi:DNA-binding MarR family transcriptional regulator
MFGIELKGSGPNNMEKRSLGFETRKLAHAIKLYVDGTLSKELDIDLSGVEGMTLGYLFHHPDEVVTAQSLMEHFKVKKAACSQLLHALSNKGLIAMKPIPTDKRVKRIVLTKKGNTLHAEFDRIFAKINAQIEKDITPEEREQYECIVAKMASNIGADSFFMEDK